MPEEKKQSEELQDKFNTEDITVLVEDGEVENVYNANDKAKQ